MDVKVAHLVYSFGAGGLERVIVNLINQTHSEVDHQVITQTADQSFASKLTAKIPFYCINKQEGTDLASHWRLYKLLRELKPDVLHTYNFGTLEYQFVAWLAGVKLRIHAEHGRESSYKKIANPAKYEYFRRLLALFLSYFVVVSPDLKSWAQDRIKLSGKKLKLIFNGIDLNEFAVTSIGQVSDKKCFVSVGRLVDVKNHALLIQSFALAREKSQRMRYARLVIVGDGPNHQSLLAQIQSLGLSEFVEMLGHCDDVPGILRQAVVFVLPSRYEAQPMTALEAMACQLPVIATDVGGVSHIIQDQHNGLLVASEDIEGLANALCYVLDKPQTMQRMGVNGRALVESGYSVEAMSNMYKKLYGVESIEV